MNAWDLQSRHHLQTKEREWAEERTSRADQVSRDELRAMIDEPRFQSRIVAMVGQAAEGLASAGARTRSRTSKLRLRWPVFLSAE